MNPLLETGLIVQRELRKNFRSVKGIILTAMSLLGGLALALVLHKIRELEKPKVEEMGAEAVRAMREVVLGKYFNDDDIGKYMVDAPQALFVLLIATIWLAPLLVALLGFDSVSSDIQHRSIRYWTVRSRRASYFVGKFAGLWVTVSAITLAISIFIWVLLVARGDETFGTTLSWGLRLWLVTLPIGAAWCGIATLVGSLFRSPILALLTTFGVFFIIWVMYAIGAVSEIAPLKFAYPNYYQELLLSTHPERAWGGFGGLLGLAAATVGLGSFLLGRRDV